MTIINGLGLDKLHINQNQFKMELLVVFNLELFHLIMNQFYSMSTTPKHIIWTRIPTSLILI
jgi:hypothetical protein